MSKSPATGLFTERGEGEEETVLIGVVRRRADLERAIKDGWYRIPGTVHFRRWPRYLALYPVMSCGRGGGSIRCYFPVEGVTRRRRIDLLPEEPEHPQSGEWYWRIELGPPVKLDRPVQNRLWRRVVFAYTTLSRLKRSREIGELFGIPPLEEIARQALVEAGIPAREQLIVRNGKKWCYRIDFVVFCREGKIALECDHSRWHGQPAQKKRDRLRDRRLTRQGWTVVHLPEDAILLEPLAAIGPLRKLIASLGGLIPEKE